MSAAHPVAVHKSPSVTSQQVAQVARGTSVSIGNWVRKTAQEHGITYRSTLTRHFAEAASRLSDADVELDQIEQLLIALRRAGIITAIQRGLLQSNYLR